MLTYRKGIDRYYVDLDGLTIGWVRRTGLRTWDAYLQGDYAGPHASSPIQGWRCDHGAPRRADAAEMLEYWYRRFNQAGA